MPAAATYADLAAALNRWGRALANMASLPHISVAGAIATGTHGAGERLGNLATAVTGIELVTSAGDTVTASEGDPTFPGLVVGLGRARRRDPGAAADRAVLRGQPARL